jgi:hypothetical protein
VVLRSLPDFLYQSARIADLLERPVRNGPFHGPAPFPYIPINGDREDT